MSLIKGLKEKRGNLLYQLKEAVQKAEKENNAELLASDEVKAWEKEIETLEKRIKDAERLDDLTKDSFKPVDEPVKEKKPTDEGDLRTFMDWARNGEKDMTPEQKSEFKAAQNRANQFYTTDNKGGYTIPTLLHNQIIAAQKYFGGMLDRSLCQWITTSTGAALEVPVVDDTSNSGYLVAEKTDMNTSASDMTFAVSTLNAYKYTSGMVKVSRELLQDSAFDFAGWLVEQLTIRLFRGLNAAFTTGSGSSQPNGVVTASQAAESLAKRTIAVSDIENLLYYVDKAYRNNGTFMFHDSTEKLIRRIAMSATYNENVSLWQPSFKDGVPDTIMGKPYVINNDMAEIPTTGLTAAKVILFGDFKKFVIRESLPLKLVRLDERYAESDEVAFALLGRWDSELPVASTTYPIAHGYMATT